MLAVKTLMALSVEVVCLGLTAWVVVPSAVGQEESVERKVLDPRFQPLVGTWEGRVQFRSSETRDKDRVLVIEERAGELEAKYGTPGKRLTRVALSVEVIQSTIRVSFRTGGGSNITLSLVKDDRLSGVFVISFHGPGLRERSMELQRKR
jgi:hypothetical protein